MAEDVVPESEFCYHVTKAAQHYTDIEETCKVLGGRLATIPKKYNNSLVTYIDDQQVSRQKSKIWIGLKANIGR